MNNYSNESQDERPITRVLYEKAAFGAVPLTYKLHGDDRLHPVQFVKHPELASVQFSDGTSIVVSQPPEPVYKGEPDRDPNEVKELNRTEEGPSLPPLSTRLFNMDLPETATEDLASGLADAVTQTVTEDVAKVPVVDDGMPMTYPVGSQLMTPEGIIEVGRTDPETRRLAEKFAPKAKVDDDGEIA